MALLDDVKANLRLIASTFDSTEIQPLIEACKLDLGLAGVANIVEEDALIKRAVIFYCKAHFGFDEKADRYLKCYENLKIVLSLSGEYNTVAEVDVNAG